MEKSRLLNVEKPITLAKFLKELALERNTEIVKMFDTVRIYDNIGNEIYDSFEVGTLISDFEMFAHLDDEVKKARATDYDKYFLIEIFL